METLPQTGRVVGIGLRGSRREPVFLVDQVVADPEHGLLGDHYSGRSGTRHVTLIQAEHMGVIASCLGMATIEPELLRRNLVIQGINLLALKDQTIQVGEVELHGTGQCHPCSRMEELLGPGGYNAVRGHGGITAKVISGGMIRLGDPVSINNSMA